MVSIKTPLNKTHVYRFFHSSPKKKVACFQAEDRKYFHTDKIDNFLVPMTFEELLRNKTPFISYRVFLISKESEYMIEKLSDTVELSKKTIYGASWTGVIPYNKNISYSSIEKIIQHDVFRNLNLHISKGKFWKMTFEDTLSPAPQMVYLYLGYLNIPSPDLQKSNSGLLESIYVFSRKEILHAIQNQQILPFECKFWDRIISENILDDFRIEVEKSITSSSKPINITQFSIAAIVGRFQPFHNGHLKLILHILKNHTYVKIGIGSAQYKNTENNPYSFKQRKEMIISTLEMHDINSNRYTIYAIPDFHDYEKWITQVFEIMGKFEIFYSNSSWTRQIMNEHGIEVAPPLKFKFDLYNGSHIRKLIRSNRSFDHLVPASVSVYIQKISSEKGIHSNFE